MIWLIVTVVEPVAVSIEEGIVNVPVLVPMVNVAVEEPEFTPESVYDTVYVPVPSDVEFTVTTDEPPRHGAVAVGEENELIFGTALTVMNVEA